MSRCEEDNNCPSLSEQFEVPYGPRERAEDMRLLLEDIKDCAVQSLAAGDDYEAVSSLMEDVETLMGRVKKVCELD
jgi:hypothetical protein